MKVSTSPPVMRRSTATVVVNVPPKDVNVMKLRDLVMVDVIRRGYVRIKAKMGPGNIHFT